MQRRELITLGATVIASASVPRWAAAQTPEKTKVILAVGGKNLLYYLPLTIAEQLGYFKAEGLDVTIVDFAGGAGIAGGGGRQRRRGVGRV
jgi:NitT/TauT family transport system substrate-binding protein